MPPSNTQEDQRFARYLPALFWGGVALAPIAALMLLVGSGTGSLRAAVGLVILSVILIGLSITLRRDSENLRNELEDVVFDEIDVVRADVRDDIGHAVQATHRAFGEKLQYLLDQVESTRAELESTRAQLEALRHQQVPAAAHRSGPPAPSAVQPGQRPGMPSGIVRHTETVQVTTRHTVMDPNEDGQRGTTYGARQPATARGSVPPSRDRDESWTEQRLREQMERRRDAAEPVSGDRWQREPHEERWSAPVIDEDDDRRPGVRAGDRWASVRSDDRGRELRMGERRAGLYSDGQGTELRIEDRWAAVRREAGLDRPRWGDDDDRLEAPREFPYRDRDRDRDQPGRRAITGSDRESRWSDYDDRDRDRDRDRERDRHRDRYR